MADAPPDERAVYLAFHGVLTKEERKYRKLTTIRRCIAGYITRSNVKFLVHEHGLDDLSKVVKRLLIDGVFDSTIKAKSRFPEAFEVSPTQIAERAMSELEASKAEAAAIECVTRGTQESIAKTQRLLNTQPEMTTFSLYPVYLPFVVQHRLLKRMQRILENACYSFAQKTLGNTLRHKGWDCPEAIELNWWPPVFHNHQEVFSSEDLDGLFKPLDDVLESMARIRHSAVHRLRLTAKSIMQLTVDAESMLALFHDEEHINEISNIRRQIQSLIDDAERHKDLLESRVIEMRKVIEARKAELDRQEKEVLAMAFEEDMAYLKFVGLKIENALVAPGTVTQKAESLDVELSSEAEFDDIDTRTVEAELSK
ncbi:hypothetical protein DM02DRAFT_686219 [Periconia macrospinosa]|uniref:Ubiquinol-cytochrome-c reductase cytochrome c1 n=1 Tax=Periconia macrospinosa TaxID=97972 RepID=A0A2V1E450_9PLEO|nr:hypothetical protein DM02DRAFT_686219 [Periconia macrospinosa]